MAKDEKPDPLVRQRFASVWPSPDDDLPADPPPSSAWERPPRTSGSDAPPRASDPALRPAGATALAALNPGRRAVKALAAVAVAVFLIAAFVAWHSQPRPEVVASPSTSAAITVATIPAPTTASVSPSAAGSAIVVAVTGRVRHPGLVTLPSGARVADAIAAAGGALPNTDLSFVNLARRLNDGELIVIGVQPSPGEVADPTGGATSAAGGGPAGPVDINTAGLTQLETLPGIGPALAQRIVDYRTQHGTFHRIDDLQNVPGIGPSKYADLKDQITV